jgi:hypothetical protein
MKTLDRRDRIVSSLLTDEMDRSKENTYDCTKYVDVGLICKKSRKLKTGNLMQASLLLHFMMCI